MQKKQQRIQIILISIGLLLILLTYFYYPYMKQVKLMKNQTTKEIEKNIDVIDKETTSFKNVEYKGLYDFNKPFIVRSEKAHILNKEPDIVYMDNMRVILNLSDGRIVNIVSKKGKYNKKSYDCFFYDDVKATDGETKIFAENLDLLATKNYVEIYKDVRLIYPTGTLQADRVDYDFEAKNFKVSMFDDSPVKVKVIK